MQLLLSHGGLLALLVALPLVAALLLPLLRRIAPWIALAVALAETLAFAALGGQELLFEFPWIPAVGSSLALRLDDLAWIYGLLISSIGALIIFYSLRYLPHELEERRSLRSASTFYSFLLYFLASMIGLVLADDLILLYVFWESTSVASLLLIAFHLHEEKAREGALKSYVITATTGIVLLLGLLSIGASSGSFRISELQAGGLGGAISLAVVVGAAAKSAQLPFHTWLPAAMVAPTPVSAWLHSATLVAAGVFLLARLDPLLAPIESHGPLLVMLGAATMLVGGAGALVKTHVKELLAWSTISQYGYVTLLLGLGARSEAIFYIAGHAVLKSGLFLAAGIVTRATGEDDVRKLGKLWRSQPLACAVTGILSLALAGLPLTVGFWMKELLFERVLREDVPWISAVALIAGSLTFVYMLRFFWLIFVAGPPPLRTTPQRQMLWLLAAPALCALAGIWLGLLPPVDTHTENHRPLYASLLSFALGLGLFGWMRLRDVARATPEEGAIQPGAIPAVAPAELISTLGRSFGFDFLYRWSLESLDHLGSFFSRMQSGRLLHYLLFLFAVPVILALALLPEVPRWPAPLALRNLDGPALAFGALSLSAMGLAVGSAIIRSHVGATLMVGGVGFLLALIYGLLHAPDVALVQVAVETVTAMLLLIALGRIDMTVREQSLSSRGQRSPSARAATVSLSIGLGLLVSFSVLAISQALGDPALGKTYLFRSGEEGMDPTVTAILVDFRGFDTLGEISVFAAAVLGVTMLLGKRIVAEEKKR